MVMASLSKWHLKEFANGTLGQLSPANTPIIYHV